MRAMAPHVRAHGSPHGGADARLGAPTGRALKIFNVPGPTLLEDEPDTGTIDYANINGPIFFGNTIEHVVGPGGRVSQGGKRGEEEGPFELLVSPPAWLFASDRGARGPGRSGETRTGGEATGGREGVAVADPDQDPGSGS